MVIAVIAVQISMAFSKRSGFQACMAISIGASSLKDDLLLLAQPYENFGSRAVADTDLDRLAFAAFGLTRRRNFNRGVALLVVNHGAFGHQQRALVFFQDDLGVRCHIGAQQIARVV